MIAERRDVKRVLLVRDQEPIVPVVQRQAKPLVPRTPAQTATVRLETKAVAQLDRSGQVRLLNDARAPMTASRVNQLSTPSEDC